MAHSFVATNNANGVKSYFVVMNRGSTNLAEPTFRFPASTMTDPAAFDKPNIVLASGDSAGHTIAEPVSARSIVAYHGIVSGISAKSL